MTISAPPRRSERIPYRRSCQISSMERSLWEGRVSNDIDYYAPPSSRFRLPALAEGVAGDAGQVLGSARPANPRRRPERLNTRGCKTDPVRAPAGSRAGADRGGNASRDRRGWSGGRWGQAKFAMGGLPLHAAAADRRRTLMEKLAILSVLLIVFAAAASMPHATDYWRPQTDEEAIVQVARDYLEGFYDGSAERMTRALHPDLAKRDIVTDRASGGQIVRNMTAQQLIDVTGSGAGSGWVARYGRQCDVTVLDIFHDVASVKVVAGGWIDYLHVAKVNGEWKIVNVLWALKPKDS
jgi:hypothetical protein